MKILINGYYYGANCPPYFSEIKKVNLDTKLTNSLSILDEHGVNYEYLDKNDIVDLNLNLIEKFIIKVLKKVRLSIWKSILIRKAKELIDEYKPDIIINHKASEKAEVMLKTGFHPQITLIYGGEVHGDQIKSKNLDYIFKESTYILTTTKQMEDYIVREKEFFLKKIKTFPWGHFNHQSILNHKKKYNKLKLRVKYGFDKDDKIILSNRSLRGEHTGIISIIEALRISEMQNIRLKVVLLKGFGGKNKTINLVKSYIKKYPILKDHIVIIDRILSNAEIWDFYYLSDCFISILPNDQFGTSIMDAVLFENSLILSDLKIYTNELGEGPYYISNQNKYELKNVFERICKNEIFMVNPAVVFCLGQKYNSRNNFIRLNNFIDDIVKGQ